MTENKTNLNAIFSRDFLSNPKKALEQELPSEKEFDDYVLVHQFDVNRIPPEDSHIFFYNGLPIGSRGNIVAITGKAKSRKTVVASALATSAFISGPFIGFTADIKPDEIVLHVDTEQGYYHYYGSVKRIFKDAGHSAPPGNFKSIHTRDASVEFRIGLVEYLLPRLKPRVMILDGITDFVRDLNNQEEATAIGEKLLAWSYKYDMLIIVVIHTTKTTGYMTGAVGTHLEKKSQTVIKVERDDDANEKGSEKGSPDISHVSCQYARDKAFKSFSIHFDEQLGRYDATPETMVTTKGKQGDKRPENYPEDMHAKIIARMFGYSELIPEGDIQNKVFNAVKQITGDFLEPTNRRQFVKYYNERALIFQNPEGAWMRPALGTTSNHTNAGAAQTGQISSGGLFAPSERSDASDDDLPF